MEIENILKVIHDRYGDEKRIARFYTKYTKKCNINAPSTAQDFVRLAYVLYLLDDVDSALLLLSLFTPIEFKCDYNIWTPVDHALILLMRINRIEGNTEVCEELKSKVIGVLDCGTEGAQRTNKKVFSEMLAGETLYYKNIEEAIEENNYRKEFTWRLDHLMRVMKIRELGGSEKYPVSKADEEVELNIARLKELLPIVKWKDRF